MRSSADAGVPAQAGTAVEAHAPHAGGHVELDIEHIARLLKEQPVGFCYLDAELRYRYVNDRLCAMNGVPREDLLGRRVRDVLPEIADLIEAQLKDVLATGQPVVSEMIGATTRATGDRKGYYEHNFTPFRSPSGEIVGVCCVVSGADRRRRMEEALARAQRLESIGRLAAGIAHEINTPTQFLGDNLEFLRESFTALCRLTEAYERVLDATDHGRDCKTLRQAAQALKERVDSTFLLEEIPLALDQSLTGIGQITQTVQAMRRYSQPGQGERERTHLHALTETAIAMAMPEWKYVATIERDFDPAVSEISCYPHELSRALLNLLVNAAQAIETSIGDFGPKGVIRVSTSSTQDGIEIRVHDTGCGVPDEIRERIFDPFFTTKEVGKGTGQGLALAHRTIVELHGGRLECESEVGSGTTLVIRLPGDGLPTTR